MRSRWSLIYSFGFINKLYILFLTASVFIDKKKTTKYLNFLTIFIMNSFLTPKIQFIIPFPQIISSFLIPKALFASIKAP